MLSGAGAATSTRACVLRPSKGQHVTHRMTPPSSQRSTPLQTAHGGRSVIGGAARAHGASGQPLDVPASWTAHRVSGPRSMTCPWDGIPRCGTPSVPPSPTSFFTISVSSPMVSVTCGTGAVTPVPRTCDEWDGYDGWLTSSLRGTATPCLGSADGYRGARCRETSHTNPSHVSHPSLTRLSAVTGGVPSVTGGG